MRDIVPDEQRRDGPKSARREAVALGSPLGVVGLLARDRQPALRSPPSQRASQGDHGRSKSREKGHASPISMRRASTALASNAARTSVSLVSTPAEVRSPSSLRITSSSPTSSKSAWTTLFA